MNKLGCWFDLLYCLFVIVCFTLFVCQGIMSPTIGGGGHIVFSADPVGVASCLHSIYLMNGWILANLTQIYHWVGKMLIRF